MDDRQITQLNRQTGFQPGHRQGFQPGQSGNPAGGGLAKRRLLTDIADLTKRFRELRGRDPDVAELMLIDGVARLALRLRRKRPRPETAEHAKVLRSMSVVMRKLGFTAGAPRDKQPSSSAVVNGRQLLEGGE